MLQTDEVAVVVPLRFHELKLTREAAAQEEEDTSSAEAVVFHHALGQQGTVGRTATQDAMQVDDHPLLFEKIAPVRPPDVGSERTLETLRVVVVVQEIVVALGIGSKSFAVMSGLEANQRSASI